MKYSDVMTPPQPITEEEAKSFMNSHESGTYQLVDVRMPEEYQQDHLPGAKLVPLNQLTTGAGDLDPGKPTIVY